MTRAAGGVPANSRARRRASFAAINFFRVLFFATEVRLSPRALKGWRKRVGVEPTIRPAKARIAGFESREDHRTLFAFGRDYRGGGQGVAIPGEHSRQEVGQRGLHFQCSGTFEGFHQFKDFGAGANLVVGVTLAAPIFPSGSNCRTNTLRRTSRKPACEAQSPSWVTIWTSTAGASRKKRCTAER